MNPQSRNILLVEDNPGDARLLRTFLEETPSTRYNITTVTRLSEAIACLGLGNIDAVLLDLSLPDSQGLDNVRRLREVGSAPIVILTGLENEEVAREAVQAGAQDYLAKGQVDGITLQRSIRYAIERTEIHEALRAGEARFASFMRNLPGIAFMKDLDGRYLYANEAFEEILNFQIAEWRNRTDDDIWPAQLAAQLRAHDRHVLMSRSVMHRIETIPQFEGPHHWLVSKFPILDSDQKPVMVGGIAIDITDRRRAEHALMESENKLRFITDNIRDAVFTYGMDRKLQYVNRAFENLTGYTIDELYEQNFIPYLHPEDEAHMMHLLENVYAGVPFHEQRFRIVTKSGEVRWCLSTWSPLLDEKGRQIGIQGLEADITGAVNAESSA